MRTTSALKSVLGWSFLSRVLKVRYIIYGHIHSLGERRLHSCGVWSLTALVFMPNMSSKLRKIWWSEKLLAEVEQLPSFGRIWTVWLRETARRREVLKILCCVFQTASLKYALLSSLQTMKNVGDTHLFLYPLLLHYLLLTQFFLQRFS